MSLHFAWFYFCILTAGSDAHRMPNSLYMYFCILIDFLDFYKTGDGTKQFWGGVYWSDGRFAKGSVHFKVISACV